MCHLSVEKLLKGMYEAEKQGDDIPEEDKGFNTMVKKRQEIKTIIKRYITELKRLGVDVSQVILFGSYAKGRPEAHSDIDIAVVSPSFYKLDIFERQLILSKAHHKFGEPIEPVGLTPEQVQENKGFIREIPQLLIK